ncbi:MAG: hypothetical protein IIA17_01370 [candidate division Zixibacteria bacterium]|nr:hypothetical protein [candidate division Zixibacteria bacterium]
MKQFLTNLFNKASNSRGISIIEVLIAGLITGIIATSSFSFYVSMQQQSETQYEVSELQHTCRTSLWDMKKTLRLAGFKIGSHVPYEISADTLAVYYNDTQPVDSFRYFLQEFDSFEYSLVPNLPDGRQLYKLMKQINSAPAAVYAEYITKISYNVIDPSNIVITIQAQTTKQDDTYTPNGGFREFSLAERVHLRNL